jgi:hypothetical protein
MELDHDYLALAAMRVAAQPLAARVAVVVRAVGAGASGWGTGTKHGRAAG